MWSLVEVLLFSWVVTGSPTDRCNTVVCEDTQTENINGRTTITTKRYEVCDNGRTCDEILNPIASSTDGLATFSKELGQFVKAASKEDNNISDLNITDLNEKLTEIRDIINKWLNNNRSTTVKLVVVTPESTAPPTVFTTGNSIIREYVDNYVSTDPSSVADYDDDNTENTRCKPHIDC